MKAAPNNPNTRHSVTQRRPWGLSFAYVPVATTGATVAQDVEQMRALLAQLPTPVLAFCRTGNRSSKLYELATRGARSAASYDVVVIGGGSAGISVCASLLKRDAALRIAVVEPSAEHYYQPAWTLVGGGAYDVKNTVRPTADVMPKGATWIKASLSAFAPERHVVLLSDGNELAYQQLIVQSGLNRLGKN